MADEVTPEGRQPLPVAVDRAQKVLLTCDRCDGKGVVPVPPGVETPKILVRICVGCTGTGRDSARESALDVIIGYVARIAPLEQEVERLRHTSDKQAVAWKERALKAEQELYFDRRDPAHENCRNVQEQLQAQIDVERAAAKVERST